LTVYRRRAVFMEVKKIALITGASGVLGRATAMRLSEDGIRVVVTDVDEGGLEKLVQELGRDAYGIPFDISDPLQVRDALEDIRNTVGGIDILVNNAGVLSNNKSGTTTPEEWRRVMEVNLDGAFFLSQAVIPWMKEKEWGRIVNTCSLAAKSGGITAGTAYTTSKGAMISLTFSLAMETAGYGITVNGIAPAYVRTPMVTEQLTEDQRGMLLAKIPVGRFCEPEEFAHVVSFLVHPLSGFITGEIIDQNGGLHFD
jgi:3-oxoacyl-[acyl-carrier protein] reductase